MAALTREDKLEIAAAYVETAFAHLDKGDLGVVRASLRRVAQWLIAERGDGGLDEVPEGEDG